MFSIVCYSEVLKLNTYSASDVCKFQIFESQAMDSNSIRAEKLLDIREEILISLFSRVKTQKFTSRKHSDLFIIGERFFILVFSFTMRL